MIINAHGCAVLIYMHILNMICFPKLPFEDKLDAKVLSKQCHLYFSLKIKDIFKSSDLNYSMCLLTTVCKALNR